MGEEKKQLIDFVPVQELEKKHFLVKDYQRGYKWGKKEINALLKDVTQHKEGKYCLQPIIVQTQQNGIEVIDGQQRLTSIFLVLYYLKEIQFYTIDYQTREATQGFLKNKMLLLSNSVIKDDLEWEGFITKKGHNKFNNVDIFHIYQVFFNIHQWFKSKEEAYKNEFISKLQQQIYVIWYDVEKEGNTQKAEDVFLNLNAGKIALTNSELIKALFVLDTQKVYSKEIAQLKSFEITNEWDTIENQLQDDSFWLFICDHDYYNQQDTRIDFIIDLTNKIRPQKDWDGKESYRIYEDAYANGNRLDWSTIKQTFNKLLEWFSTENDKEIYHYIGFLINTKICSLLTILESSKGVSKTTFKQKLLGFIQEEFKKVKKIDNQTITYYQLDNLDYKDYRIACQNVLLLLNIEQYINDISNNKFPFDLYKNENWSVEHINPQNPKDFENIKAIKHWLNSFKTYFSERDTEKELQENITTFLEILNGLDQTKRLAEVRLKKEDSAILNGIIEKITSLLELHKIGNLTLLDRNTNSKLGNKVFKTKRTDLLHLYYHSKNENVFIPESTKDVFTKNYSKKESAFADEIFGFQDMEDYKLHITQQLKKYYN